MGTSVFIMAILGCGDAGTACQPVKTMPTAYATREACYAQADAVLDRTDDADFPTIVADCREGSAKEAASLQRKASLAN